MSAKKMKELFPYKLAPNEYDYGYPGYFERGFQIAQKYYDVWVPIQYMSYCRDHLLDVVCGIMHTKKIKDKEEAKKYITNPSWRGLLCTYISRHENFDLNAEIGIYIQRVIPNDSIEHNMSLLHQIEKYNNISETKYEFYGGGVIFSGGYEWYSNGYLFSIYTLLLKTIARSHIENMKIFWNSREFPDGDCTYITRIEYNRSTMEYERKSNYLTFKFVYALSNIQKFVDLEKNFGGSDNLYFPPSYHGVSGFYTTHNVDMSYNLNIRKQIKNAELGEENLNWIKNKNEM